MLRRHFQRQLWKRFLLWGTDKSWGRLRRLTSLKTKKINQRTIKTLIWCPGMHISPFHVVTGRFDWLNDWHWYDRWQGGTKYRVYKSSHSHHGLKWRRWVRPHVCKNFQYNLFSWVIFRFHDKLITSNRTVKLVLPFEMKHHTLYLKKNTVLFEFTR